MRRENSWSHPARIASTSGPFRETQSSWFEAGPLARHRESAFFEGNTMSEGTIKRLTDKGFGFIANGTGKDLFFHMSAVEDVRFEDGPISR